MNTKKRHAPAALLLLLTLATCAKSPDRPGPRPGSHGHLRGYFESQGIALPSRYYEEVEAALAEEEVRYDGKYVPACVDAENRVVRLEGERPAGELLTVATGDPAIKDRSLARVIDNWADYLKDEFRYSDDCQVEGLDGPQMCSPVTYYYEYENWRRGTRETPPPQPRPFIFFPAHVAIRDESGRNPQKEIFDVLERVRQIPDERLSLIELHKFCSWLKGAAPAGGGGRMNIAGVDVSPLTSVHFTGQGTSWGPALIFPPSPAASPGAEPPPLPKPDLGLAVVNLLKKATSANPDYSAIYTARFAPGQPPDEYRAFAASYPPAVFYENLAYTRDPLAPAPGPPGREGSVLRTLLFASAVSMVQDERGRPVLNGRPQRPPSGKCLEEAAGFFHPSMVHPVDGWAMPIWSYGVGGADLRRDEREGGPLHGIPNLMVDVVLAHANGVADAWNENYKDVTPKVTTPRAAFISHMEFYDSHLYIPHGRVDLVRERLSQLSRGARTKEEWAALGYRVPDTWPCTGEKPCTEDNLGIKPIDDKCRADAACVRSVADVFKAPYEAALSRVASSLAAEHDDRPGGRTDDYGSFGEVRKMFDDPIVESVVDRVECRRNVDTVVVEDEGCRYKTPVPDTPYGKSGLVGEPLMYLWNYLWTYGSMFPIHVRRGALPADKGLHMPRYWSLADYQDGRLYVDTGGRQAGLMSYRNLEAGQVSFPAGTDYGADWFVRDTYGYFNDGVKDRIPEILKAGSANEIDLTKINRAGRGDAMYLLQYFPQRFLYWKVPAEGAAFDERYGSNLPAPSLSP